MVSIKIIVVGDGFVGKTSLIVSWTSNSFCHGASYYVDNPNYHVLLDGKTISVTVCDTAGQQEYDRFRPLTYPGASFFLICFSITSQESFQNVRTKWVPELEHHCPGVPFFLIGTKIDLKEDPEVIERLKESGASPVSHAQGLEVAREIGAIKYLECSSLSQKGVKQLFDEAIREAVHHANQISEEPKIKKKERECGVM